MYDFWLVYLLSTSLIKGHFGQNVSFGIRYGNIQQFSSNKQQHTYPFMLSFRFNNGTNKCGALMVTNALVLFPCHCLIEITSGLFKPVHEKLFHVIGGSEDISDAKKQGVQVREVDFFIPHPMCSPKERFESDFGLVVVSNPFDYSMQIQIMDRFIRTRNARYRTFLNSHIKKTITKCSLLGWRENRLKEQEVSIVGDDRCLKHCKGNMCTSSQYEYICIELVDATGDCPLLDKGSVLLEEGFIFAIFNYADCNKLSEYPIRFSLLGNRFLSFYDEYNPINESNENFHHLIILTITISNLFLSILN